MRNIVYLSGLLCMLLVVQSVGQDVKPGGISQIKTRDPFRIELGSSFSASNVPAVGDAVIATENAGSRLIADYIDALNIIRREHVGDIDDDAGGLTKSAIGGMLRALDPHSNYFDASEYRELLDEQRSEYSGIGATITNYELDGQTETYIIGVLRNSPAENAGLRFGDRIVAVDGQAMAGETSEAVRDRVRGLTGTLVRLNIDHALSRTTNTIELRRARLPQPSVPDAYMLGRDVGYIDMTNGFNYTTSDELDAALKSLKQNGMASLVLDLRGNPGGILDQAVKVAEKFLPAGSVVVSQRGRYSFDNRVWRSKNKNPETMPLVLLVDENSASASEVVAGALQDHDRALIIGGRTFGKGLVQNVINLPNGSGLTLTAARYFTPSGRSIQRDYSGGSNYNYYNHIESSGSHTASRPMSLTDAKRKVFGGDGITPDRTVKAEVLTPLEMSLVTPLFHFAVAAAAGRVDGSDYFVSGVPASQTVLTSDDPNNRHLFESFISYLAATSVSTKRFTDLRSAERFIKTRFLYNMVLSTKGVTAASRVLIENDPLVVEAKRFLPHAALLARTSHKTIK